LVTICIATVLVLDDRCHSYLLLTPCAFTSCWLSRTYLHENA
jgi:hypothetical protein